MGDGASGALGRPPPSPAGLIVASRQLPVGPGGEWPELARQAALALSTSRGPVSDPDSGTLLLADVRAILDDGSRPAVFTEDLLRELCARDERPWAEWRSGGPLSDIQLAALLRPYEIQPKQIRIGRRTAKGYERQLFEYAFSRSLAPLDPKYPKQVNGDSDFRDIPTRNTGARVSGLDEPKAPATPGVVSGVSGQGPHPGPMNPPSSSKQPPEDAVKV